MDLLPSIGLIIGVVLATIIRVRRYSAAARSKSGRERCLLKRATRAARRSQIASQTSVRLSSASSKFSSAATMLLRVAHQAQDDGRVFQFVCLYLYGKLQFYRAGWLIGRAMQFNKKADTKLRESAAIMNLVERDRA